MTDRLHYHLIGIGGAGMSAIAQVLHSRGDTVSGSDRQESDVTTRLRAAGMKISIGHTAENVDGADVVVYTAAIPKDNPEITAARRLGIPVLERPAMLGRIMEPYKHRIAVSGTHGKTTTTSMIDLVLNRGGLDASALIGGDMKSLGGNTRLGNGSIIITEACEAFESFLHLYPSIAVITNIDADHLDYYRTIDHVEESFAQFIDQVDRDGCVVACSDDPRVKKVLERCGRKVVWFGLSGSPDLRADDIDVSTPEPTYTLVHAGKPLGQIRLGVPGKHNITDSLAAAAVAFELGVEFKDIQSAMRDFRGADRRFEVLYDDNDIMVVDDYAHHPAEIEATLCTARAAYGKRIIAVFQPHLYSRTRFLLQDFADALAIADQVIVCPIYAAREQPIDGVSAESIVERMKQQGFTDVRHASSKDSLAPELAAQVAPGDMVMIIGAGDIRTVGEDLAAALRARDPAQTSRIEDLRRIASGRAAENEPMAGHTALGVGGPADYFVEVTTDNELCELMKYISSANLPWMVVGDGANILVSDKGIRGVVIRLTGDFEQIHVDGTSIVVGSAVSMARLADIAADNDLSGLEAVGAVPGTVGGAIVMNAGTHQGYIDQVTRSVSVVTSAGEKRVLSRDECAFAYRTSRFQTEDSVIITSATFALRPGDGEALREHLATARSHRSRAQPQDKSAGCFFKNPPNASAGKLIELAGGKGLSEGGAAVSDVHANFIVNANDATAADLFNLAERVRKLVRDRHGVELQYEVRLVGEW